MRNLIEEAKSEKDKYITLEKNINGGPLIDRTIFSIFLLHSLPYLLPKQ
jgi:hypothetical protein